MKIAFIVGVFSKLSETFILNQITGLIDLGHDVEIFSMLKPEEEKIHPEVNEYDLLKRTHYLQDFLPVNKVKRVFKATILICIHIWKHPWVIIKVLNVFRFGKKVLTLRVLFYAIPFLEEKFDIIHCHFGPIGKEFLFLIDILKTKYITSFHGFDFSRYVKQKGTDVYQELFKEGDLFTANTNYTKNKLIELSCNDKKIVIHPMGLRIDKFKYSERIYHPGETIRILTVARLVEKKGVEYSIRAVAKVVSKHPNIQYKIAGDGPLREKLQNLINNLGIENKIRLLGWRSSEEIIKLFQEAHLFILSSATASNGDQEGQGLVLQEAQAMGIPVLSTYHNGIPEGVINGKSGFLVPEKDVEALSEQLNYLIEHPGKWPELGRKGRRFVEEKYDNVQLSKKLEDIYTQLLKT